MTAFDVFVKALANIANLDGVLGDESVQYPPSEEVDYWATPLNAAVFGWMGVDGVHYAVLKIDGQVRDDSPVMQISPMDFDEPYSLLAPTFADYLAIGCGVRRDEIQKVLAKEGAGRSALLELLRSRFQRERFWADGVDHEIGPYVPLMVPRSKGERAEQP